MFRPGNGSPTIDRRQNSRWLVIQQHSDKHHPFGPRGGTGDQGLLQRPSLQRQQNNDTKFRFDPELQDHSLYGEKTMNWHDLSENPRAIGHLYDVVPPLHGMEVVSIRLLRDGGQSYGWRWISPLRRPSTGDGIPSGIRWRSSFDFWGSRPEDRGVSTNPVLNFSVERLLRTCSCGPLAMSTPRILFSLQYDLYQKVTGYTHEAHAAGTVLRPPGHQRKFESEPSIALGCWAHAKGNLPQHLRNWSAGQTEGGGGRTALVGATEAVRAPGRPLSLAEQRGFHQEDERTDLAATTTTRAGRRILFSRKKPTCTTSTTLPGGCVASSWSRWLRAGAG